MSENNDATDIFMNIVFFRTYLELVRDIENIRLTEGFGEIADDPAESSEWYLNLDDHGKKIVKEIAKLSVAEAVFRFLVILDNHIGFPLPGTVSDFALYLQTYQSLEDRSKNQPQQSIRLNLSNKPGYDDLQNIFLHRVKRQQE